LLINRPKGCNLTMDKTTYVWFMLHKLAWRKRGNRRGVTVSIAFDDNKQNQYDYAFPLLKSRGMVGTFYVTTDYIRDISLNNAYMSIAELQDLQNYGCEIASHSKTHPHFIHISDDQIRSECSVSKQVLQSLGFQVNNFAYPYGDTNNHVDSIVRSYYRSGRSAYAPPYIMELPTSQFRLSGAAGETGNNESAFLMRYKRLRLVDQVHNGESWMIIFFHSVVPNRSRPFEIGTQDFANFLDYLVLNGVETVTVNQALDNRTR
jgi:peptidoglycan/xylan/chitin deacetylase (PgdA/CDA1 family)